MLTYHSPIELLTNRIYLFFVEGVKPVPVIFKDFHNEDKKLCNVIIYGEKAVAHASTLYMTKVVKGV